MSWAVAIAGWGLALAMACSVRRRLSLVADAEHELRGAAAAIGLAAERMRRTGASVAFSSLVRLQLDRMSGGLEDLAAARGARGRTPPAPRLDAGRLAQVLGNLVANAAEHGVGEVEVEVETSRPRDAVRIEIRNRNRPAGLDGTAARQGRGRGLAIAKRAATEMGGHLRVDSREEETVAELELPPPDDRGAPGAA